MVTFQTCRVCRCIPGIPCSSTTAFALSLTSNCKRFLFSLRAWSISASTSKKNLLYTLSVPNYVTFGFRATSLIRFIEIRVTFVFLNKFIKKLDSNIFLMISLCTININIFNIYFVKVVSRETKTRYFWTGGSMRVEWRWEAADRPRSFSLPFSGNFVSANRCPS
jgi:hypothetical protein